MAGTIVADTIQDGAGNSTAMDNAIYGSAKAWVNFNGTSGASPVIRASYNVSSVTRNTTGDYTVNFTNAFVDINYVALATSTNTSVSFGSYAVGYESVRSRTTSSWSFWTGSYNALQDTAWNNVAIFR
jgi:hypothetical protein